MNIDIKFMEEREKELRAQMRDVLTKKLGRPRKVDKTLDDLLRQMARRHKLHSNRGTIPQMLQQIREWKVGNSIKSRLIQLNLPKSNFKPTSKIGNFMTYFKDSSM